MLAADAERRALRIAGSRIVEPMENVGVKAPYEILMPEAVIRYGVLAAFDASKAAQSMRPCSGGCRV